MVELFFPMSMTEKNKKKKEVEITTMVCAVISLVVGYLGLIAIGIYAFGMDNALTKKTTGFIPYPAAIVGKNIITISNLAKKVSSVRSFYENQDYSQIGMRVDFTTSDGKKRLKIKEKNVLNKLIENLIVEQEANRQGIKLTSEIVSQEVSRKMEQYGNESEVRENLSRLYGWNLADFENNIVKPDMYKEKLLENLKTNDSSYKDAKEKAGKALSEVKGGTDFKTVIKRYSEGDSAKNDGDLGWFGADEMLPEISSVVFLLDKSKVSDIIESPLGYHIVKVEDKKKTRMEQKKCMSGKFL
jgi:parvulin-like peptidyl-prolyl isomerase